MGIKIPPIYPLGLTQYLSVALNKAGHKATYINLDYDDTLIYANPFSRVKNISFYKKYLEQCDKPLHCNTWKNLEDLLILLEPDIVGISYVTVKMGSVLKIARIVKNYSSDIYEHLQFNYTKTISDESFNKLVDETYMLCYKINKKMSNVFK